MAALTGEQIAAERLEGWAYWLNALHTRVATPDFATGLALVDAIGAEAERCDHHPELDLRYSYLSIRTTSYDTGGVTSRDVRLARVISELVAAAGLSPGCQSVSQVEFGLDTPDGGGPAPFWAAILGGEVSNGEVTSPHGDFPTVWFQRCAGEEPRQHWHPDVWLDPALVQPRIDAAVAAGGRLVTDEYAPSFWVLEDPEGNKVCLCTWQERD